MENKIDTKKSNSYFLDKQKFRIKQIREHMNKIGVERSYGSRFQGDRRFRKDTITYDDFHKYFCYFNKLVAMS